ncbi:hypothetical protein LMG28140_04455 [Paraburkholderia metrosideri]|jgi:hypothetical protein|uniref:Uncharacterized protein n=1 Tax=Paraburkholderia metrosideri TaxID=580937 RepID=A0ABN7I4I9_9BURK|nr:hypothetical protein LMG28140_04455 [Paraburkholderia metrosideri]
MFCFPCDADVTFSIRFIKTSQRPLGSLSSVLWSGQTALFV